MTHHDAHSSLDAHPSLDAMADHRAGVGTAETAHHVGGCPDCTTTLAALTASDRELDQVLISLPELTMPADVAARIDEALSAEARANRGPTNVIPLASRRRPALPGWAAAAAVVVLVGGGAVLAGNNDFFSGKDRGSSASNAAGATSELAPVLSSSGFDYSAAGLAASLPGLLSGRQSAALQTGRATGLAGAAVAPSAAAAPKEHSAAKDSAGGAAGVLSASPADQLDALKQPDALAACLVRALGTDVDQPLAVDLASFDGSPAVIVALPALSKADRVDIYVLDPGCPEGTFRYFARLPLPSPR